MTTSLPTCLETSLKKLAIGLLACVFGGPLCHGQLGHGAEPDVRFNRDILPILADHCFTCHGFDPAGRQAGLRLDTRAGALTELESGARAVVPGDLAASELWARVWSSDPATRMPPAEQGRGLSSRERELLRRWIEEGAVYEPHWAWLAPVTVEPPAVAGVTAPIDRFVRSRLAREGLTPSPPADRVTLLRRVSLDLTGLPPAPAEIEAFENDPRPDAYERVVERLLQSPHFGEHWGRWWLDLAHYADSDGYLQDFLRPVAWRYRQWVVDAFNRDLPFDEFTGHQLAGDLLPDGGVMARLGTGYLRNTLSNREGGADLEEYRVNQVRDRVQSVGTTWLGLTVGCAQCHDHKFDPLSQREYYQLYAFFNVTDEANFDAPLPGEWEPHQAAKAAHDRQRAELVARWGEPLAQLQAEWERMMLRTEAQPGEDFGWDRALELLGLQWGQNLGEGQLEGLNIIKTPPEKRTAAQRDRLLDYFLGAPPPALTARFNELKLAELKVQLDALAKTLPKLSRAPGVMAAPVARPTHVHVRGDYLRPAEPVTAGTPAILPPLRARRETVSNEPGRRELAEWLVSGQHPLTARVTVNRLWQELFGRGLVATSENFGLRGDRPSHPELLDWLAVRFVAQGWSVKSLLRTLVLSQTYRQSSQLRPELLERDPRNIWLARQGRWRLSAEQVRDAGLAASGLLNTVVGGPSVKPPQPASVSKEGYANTWEASPGADRYRRGLYTWLQRTSPFAQLVTFDLPDTSRSCSRRERTNTPLQALTLLNDPVFFEMAVALAARVTREIAENDDARRLERAWRLTVGRRPTPEERDRMLASLTQQRELFAADPAAAAELLPPGSPPVEPAWVTTASVLLNLDEFLERE
ncbi:MAG: PSD1 and planctomycete cytochrome C domain-containing protein [Planctomycetaceae bacterium]